MSESLPVSALRPPPSALINEATIHQLVYKPGPMRDMFVCILKIALRREEFSANDLPVHGEVQHGGPGIAGCVIRQLLKDGIIAPVGTWQDRVFYPKVLRNKIGIYRLDNASLARTLLDRHDHPAAKYEQIRLL